MLDARPPARTGEPARRARAAHRRARGGPSLPGEPTLDPARLSHEPLTVVPRDVNPALHDRIIGQLTTRGATVSVHQEIPSLDRMLPLVLTGAAIAITSPSAAAARRPPGVAYRYFTDPSPEIDCRLVWRRDDSGAAVARLVEVVRELRDGGALLPPELRD